jgi:hypothetical protein
VRQFRHELFIIRRYVGAFRPVHSRGEAQISNDALADRDTAMPSLHNILAVIAVVVAGALITYSAYRRSAKRTAQNRTASDVRSELRADQESLRAAIEALPAQIDLARRSRTAAAHAAANTGPEGLQQWLRQLELDLSETELLRTQLSAVEADDHRALSDMEVDIKLVEVLALSLRASTLADKYRASNSVQNFVQETDRGRRNDDAAALLREATEYSLNGSKSPISESAA